MKNKSYAIFGIVFLMLSLAGAIYLTTQNADLRNRAAIDPGTCMCKKGTQTIKGTCKNNNGCECPDGYVTGANKCNEAVPTIADIPNPADKCQANQPPECQKTSSGQKTGYLCKCLTILDPNDWQCTTYDPQTCATDYVPPGWTNCTDKANSQYVTVNGGCVSGKTPGVSARLVQCKGDVNSTGCSSTTIVRQSNSSLCFDTKFCGAQQIDVSLNGSDICWLHRNSNDCAPNPTTPPSATNTPPKTSTPTPVIVTATPSKKPTPTPTYIIVTDTPSQNSPTPTYVIVTNTPNPTPTVGYLGCGYTPCDNGGNQCSSGLTCITANNSNQYCSQPQYVSTCKTNPGYTGCCTAPIVEGPSPTRIVLPVSGFEFPSQALTLVGGIATLLGFLILL